MEEENTIVDSRYLSYSRFYIADVLKADTSKYHEPASANGSNVNRGVVKINNTYLYKVCICGNIVSIYESNKFFRFLT